MKKQRLKQSVLCFALPQPAFESSDRIYSRRTLLRATFSDPFPAGFGAATLNLGRFSQGILQKPRRRLKEIMARDSQTTGELLFGERRGEETEKAPAPQGRTPKLHPALPPRHHPQGHPPAETSSLHMDRGGKMKAQAGPLRSACQE